MGLAAILVGQADPPPIDFENLVDDSLSSADWIRAGVVVLVAVIVAIIANRVARSIGERTLGPGFAALLISRTIGYIIVLIGVIYALGSLGVRIGPLLGALGLGGLVLALALQGIVENFFSGLILQSRRPFRLGDTVCLGDHVGIVKDIDSRTVVLRQLDGSWVRVPNGLVLKEPIVTLTQESFRRSHITVGVAFETDLAAAEDTFVEALDRVARICDDPPPLAVLTDIGSSTINFEVYYWHPSDVSAELAATHDVVLAIHQAAAAAGISLAFPQVVVWPGQDPDGDLYGPPGDEVFTEHAAIAAGRQVHHREASGGWRPWRRH